MQRPCFRFTARSCGALLVACLVLAAGRVLAQSATSGLSPYLSPRTAAPSRFQQQAQTAMPPESFTPPLSGVGDTGYDATNARKKTKAKQAQGAKAPKTDSANDANAQALGSGQATSAPVSPYQKPPPPLQSTAVASGAYAQAPGSEPPVEFSTIRPPKKRKVHPAPEDPYAPLGIESGAFTLFPSVDLIGGYDTNPGQTPDGKGSALWTVAPALQVQSNWSRHAFNADLRGSYTGYTQDQTPTLSRPYFDGKVTGRVDVSHDTRIDLGARDLVSTDNPGSPNLQAGISKLPIFTTFGGDAGIGHRFNRFELEALGDVSRTVYQNSQLTDGTTASNEDRDFNQYGGTLRGSYEVMPGVKPFVEVEADSRVHDLETDFYGYQRNSTGITPKAGSTFQLSNLLTGEIALGYTWRKYEDPRLENIAGLVGDASLIWTATTLTTVKLSGASSVGESTVPGVSGVFYRDVGLQVDHALRRWLIGTIKVGYGQDDYVGMDRTDNRYTVGLGLTYKVNRNAQIKGEVRQQWLRSNMSVNNYNATTFLLGLHLQE